MSACEQMNAVTTEKKGTSQSTLRSRSRIAPNKRSSKAWTEESRETFLNALTTEHTDSVVRKRKYLVKNEGKHDADILGLDLPTPEDVRKPTPAYEEEHKKKRVAITTSKTQANFVKLITNTPNIVSLTGTNNIKSCGDTILNNKSLLKMLDQIQQNKIRELDKKKKQSIFKNIFKKSNKNQRTKSASDTSINQSISTKKQPSLESVYATSTDSIRKPFSVVPFLETGDCKSYSDAMKLTKCCLETLQQRESEIKTTILKYIKDPNTLQQLQDKINAHIKSQMDAERQAWNMTNELYAKQLDVSKIQNEKLLTTIDSLIRENRRVQSDYDSLEKQNERLLINLKIQRNDKDNKFTQDLSEICLTLYKSNEDLRNRLSTNLHQLEALEKETKRLKNENLNLNNSNQLLQMEIDSHKAVITKSQQDFYLEITFLTHELELKQQTIQNCERIGNDLIHDLKLLCKSPALKESIQLMDFENDLNKLNNLTNILKLSKTCIAVLTYQISSSYFNLTNTTKQCDNLKLQLEQIRSELNLTNEKLSQSLVFNDNIQIEKIKNQLSNLFQEYEEFKINANKSKAQLQQTLSEYINEIDNLKQQIKSMDKEKIENNQLAEVEIKKLKTVINTLKKETRENRALSDDLISYQKEASKYKFENNCLKDQISTYTSERNTIVEYQNQYYEHLLQLHSELDKLKESSSNLEMRYVKEHEEKLKIETEYKQQKEHLDFYKKLPNALQHEKNLVKELEKSVLELQSELTKLNIMHEYNKQFQDHQNTLLNDRAKIIDELKNKLSDMLEQHYMDTKDKMLLCNEVNALTEQVKKLNSTVDEMKLVTKNYENEVGHNANIRENELCTLKQLGEEYQQIVKERDKLLKSNGDLIVDNEKLLSKLNKNSEDFTLANQRLTFVQENFGECEKEVEKMKILLEKERQRAQKSVNTVSQLTKEKQTLESSIEYLQCTIRNLNEDLNSVRKINQETETKFNQQVELTQSLYEQINTLNQTLQDSLKKYTNLETENNCLHTAQKTVESQFQQLKYEFLNLKDSAQNDKLQIESINTSLLLRNEEYHRIKQELQNLEQAKQVSQQKIEELEQQCVNDSSQIQILTAEIENKDHILRKQLQIVQKCNQVIPIMTNQLSNLENMLMTDQIELEQLTVDYQQINQNEEHEFQSLKDLIDDLINQLNEQKHNTTKENHQQLAGSLIRIIELLTREHCIKQNISQKHLQMKSSREQSLNHLHNLGHECNWLVQQLEYLNTETKELELTLTSSFNKDDQQSAINQLLAEKDKKISELNSLNETLLKQVNNLQKSIDEYHSHVIGLQKTIGQLEKELTKVEFKNQQLELKLVGYTSNSEDDSSSSNANDSIPMVANQVLGGN